MEHEAREESVKKDSFGQIGADINAARLAKGLQINELSQHLRISKHHLKSIESGDFDDLPGATYAAGYLRSFAQEVGLDPVELTQRYRALLSKVEKDPAYSFPVDTQRPQRSGAMLASILVIFAVAGYGGWYAIGKPDVLTALTGELKPETAARLQIESTATEPDDMANRDAEPIDLAASNAPATADPAPAGEAVGEMVTTAAVVLPDPVTPLAAPPVIETVEDTQAVVPPVVTPASETDIASAPVAVADDTIPAPADTADETLADSALPVATTPAAGPVTTPAAGPVATPAAGPVTTPAAGPVTTPVTTGTDLAAVDGAIGDTISPAPVDDVIDDRMVAATLDSQDAMNSSMSGQIGTGVAFARQRVPDMEITLRATGASWVEIIRNDGDEVMARLMRSGETYMIDSRDRLYLSTGNAGGLELVFNDGTVRSVGESGEILRDLLLDVDKLRNQF